MLAIFAFYSSAFLESMCFYVELFYGVVISEIFKFMNCAISNNFTAQLRCALAFDHRMFTCDDEMSGNSCNLPMFLSMCTSCELVWNLL